MGAGGKRSEIWIGGQSLSIASALDKADRDIDKLRDKNEKHGKLSASEVRGIANELTLRQGQLRDMTRTAIGSLVTVRLAIALVVLLAPLLIQPAEAYR